MISDQDLRTIQEKLRDPHLLNEAEKYVGEAGRAIYRKLQKNLEAEHLREHVIINVATGDYVVAPTLLESMDQFEARFGNAPSWGIRVGVVQF